MHMLNSVKKMKMSYIALVGLIRKKDKCFVKEIIQDATPSKRKQSDWSTTDSE